MGYINDFRAKLSELIEDGRTEEAVKFAADKVPLNLSGFVAA